MVRAWLAVAAAGENTEQDMRDAGLSAQQIQEFQDELEASRTQERKLPTLGDYLAGGRDQEGPLTNRIAHGGEEGLGVARQVLHRTELREMSWPDYAVLNGLSKRTSPAVLDLLGEAVALHGPRSALWRPTRDAWAAAFRRLHGDAGFELAKERVANPTLTEQERALNLRVLEYARSESDRRTMAIEVYRPYLHVDAPELQRAAVSVAWDLWDYEAWGEIEEVAWTSPDWKARSLANGLITSFYMLGPDPSARPIDRHGNVRGGAYDPGGLREWRTRRREWDRKRLEQETAERPSPLPPSSDGPSATPRARGAR